MFTRHCDSCVGEKKRNETKAAEALQEFFACGVRSNTEAFSPSHHGWLGVIRVLQNFVMACAMLPGYDEERMLKEHGA